MLPRASTLLSQRSAAAVAALGSRGRAASRRVLLPAVLAPTTRWVGGPGRGAPAGRPIKSYINQKPNIIPIPSPHRSNGARRGLSSLPPVATPVLGLTESQREYYELARAFAEKELAPEKVLSVCGSGMDGDYFGAGGGWCWCIDADAGSTQTRCIPPPHNLRPQAAKWDAEGVFPVETLKQAAGLGFGAVFVKEDVGGSGLSRLEGSVVFEALAAG